MVPLFLPMLLLSPRDVSEEAFMIQLFTQYHGLIFATALQRLHRPDLADEVVSLACEKLIPQVKTLMQLDEGQLKTYVYRTAISCAIDLARSEQRRLARVTPLDAIDDWEIANETAEALSGMEARASVLADALERLSGDDREIIHLYYYDGYSQKEIADKLGIQPVSVASRLCRARKRLHQILTGMDMPPLL